MRTPQPFRAAGRASAVLEACATILVVAAALVVAIAAAQQPPQPTFRTGANYVRVDAYPTQDGVPVADLTAADFEVLENGTPQKIEQFERVVIHAAGAQEARVEPNTVAESRSMADNPRARLFVVFLDLGHVEVFGSHNIRKPLTDALERVIGADDLVAVMTPEMSPTDLAFARKTTTIAGLLARRWYWGERDQLIPNDPAEQQYEYCYGDRRTSAITAEMIDRRREKQTLDALRDLVVHLGGLREERKAVLAVSDGWVLYTPNYGLMQAVRGRPPSGPPIIVDPRTGKLSTRDTANPGAASYADCERDRVMLAQINNRDDFLRLPDEANRANVSFYPIDPRGLPVFDSPITNPLPLAVDAAMLRKRLESLQVIAENTDGMAIVNSNDLARGLRRVVDDLSSYYLLGYYSNGKLDGKFHAIAVRVKRPGVQVRARRGYLAATPEAVLAAARGRNVANGTAPAKAAAAPDAGALAVSAAIAGLAGYVRDVPVRLHAAAGWKVDRTAGLWVAGELGAGEEWKGGAEADVMLTTAAGDTLASKHATVSAGTRSFVVALAAPQPLSPGDYVVRVRARAAVSTAATNETLRIALAPLPASTGALFTRRGPFTGNRDVPAADLRFRRNEQVRVEIPGAEAGAAVAARLLDRTGKPLNVPVTATIRDDATDGARWVTAQLALTPLGPGDYIVEITAGGTRTLAAFRVVQ